MVSNKDYQQEINISQEIIHPAIDPLTEKNAFLPQEKINKYLVKYKIHPEKPFICQISRYDKWKDFEGVIKIFKQVKKEFDCQLVLLGNMAIDDPEGLQVYQSLMEKYGQNKDILILANAEDNDLLVNALQRQAQVIIQKSLKEGFALTVSEALYKGTPVVGSNIGGIPLQIIDGYNGYLHLTEDIQGFSQSILKILKNKELREKLGQQAKSYISKNFIITRLLSDWLNLFAKAC